MKLISIPIHLLYNFDSHRFSDISNRLDAICICIYFSYTQPTRWAPHANARRGRTPGQILTKFDKHVGFDTIYIQTG